MIRKERKMIVEMDKERRRRIRKGREQYPR